MPTAWHRWCRLCAKKDSTIDVFLENEDHFDVGALIHKFFQLPISSGDKAPSTICTSCYRFLLSLNKFSDRVVRVQTMYAMIIDDKINPIDFLSLEFQFDLNQDKPLDLNIAATSPVAHRSYQSSEESAPNYARGSHRLAAEDASIEPGTNPDVSMDYLVKDDDTSEIVTATSLPEFDESEHSGNEEEIINEVQPTAKAEPSKKKGRKPKEPPFPCTKCDKVFLKRKAFSAHYSTCQKEFTCQQCGKKFRSRIGAIQHQLTHLEPDKRPAFPCPHCDKRFTKATNIQTHIRAVHFGERPFVCECCGKTFATKGALKAHELTHISEMSFECKKCSKKFKSIQNLKVHEETHMEAGYSCPVCNHVLKTKRTLRTHMAVHSDVKKHKCTVCDRGFKRGLHLKNHMATHSGDRPHKCLFCVKTFIHGSDCRNHMKKDHPHESSEEMMES